MRTVAVLSAPVETFQVPVPLSSLLKHPMTSTTWTFQHSDITLLIVGCLSFCHTLSSTLHLRHPETTRGQRGPQAKPVDVKPDITPLKSKHKHPEAQIFCCLNPQARTATELGQEQDKKAEAAGTCTATTAMFCAAACVRCPWLLSTVGC